MDWTSPRGTPATHHATSQWPPPGWGWGIPDPLLIPHPRTEMVNGPLQHACLAPRPPPKNSPALEHILGPKQGRKRPLTNHSVPIPRRA